MKKIFIIVACALISSTGFTKDKVFLTDLIAKNEKIPVAIYAWSTIKRVPDVAFSEPKDNKAEFPKKMQYQIADSVVKSLNEAFNTDAFYTLMNPPKYKDDFKEKGFKLWVIVDIGGTYTMTTGNISTYIFKISLAQYFHNVDDKGKIKKSYYGAKIIYEECDKVEDVANLKLKSMITKTPPDCVFEKAFATLRKNNIKFAEKQIEKAKK